MNRQLKVFLIPTRQLERMCAGEARPINWPKDGQIVALHQLEPTRNQTGVALLVTSASYPEIPIGAVLPVVTAVFAKESACA
jgi:hypothetical protein